MRILIMHKTTPRWEAGAKPTPDEMKRVGAMVGELQRSGAMLAGEGLGPSAEGARVRLAKGDRHVSLGPFDGKDALPARYAVFRAASVEDAAEVATRFGRIFGDVVVDVRPVNEPWDLGFAPKPAGLTTRRYMAVVNADAPSERGAPLTEAQRAALLSFADGLGGALLGVEHLEPSAKGKRLRPADPAAPKGKRVVVTDGPFSETKELIGGFVLVEVPSVKDAVRLATSYCEAVEVEEVDVRPLAAGA